MKIIQIMEMLENEAYHAKSWHDIGINIRSNSRKPKVGGLLWKCVIAFDYMMVEKSETDRFEQYGQFSPLLIMQGQTISLSNMLVAI
jgi:hypothetical protein